MAANWPFLAYIASHAPHGPATPAPWYAALYSEDWVIAPRTPSFGVHSPDKHWLVATQPPLTKEYIGAKIDPFYKNRLRSLRSVSGGGRRLVRISRHRRRLPLGFRLLGRGARRGSYTPSRLISCA